jgi:hypothetical protein
MQNGDEPFIMESIRKLKIEGRSPRNEKYTRSAWLIAIATTLRFRSAIGILELSYCGTQGLSFSIASD